MKTRTAVLCVVATSCLAAGMACAQVGTDGTIRGKVVRVARDGGSVTVAAPSAGKTSVEAVLLITANTKFAPKGKTVKDLVKGASVEIALDLNAPVRDGGDMIADTIKILGADSHK